MSSSPPYLKPHLAVIATAAEIDPERMARASSVVVVDILRATTTILAALAAGAKRIIPLSTVEEARKVATTLSQRGESLLLAGERGGKPLEGFDLGNSPQDFLPERVKGKTIVFTTTNGTLALKRSSAAQELIAGAFGNANAVWNRLRQRGGDAIVGCAGQEGTRACEDLLFAGWVASQARKNGFTLDEQALRALELWEDADRDHGADLERRLCGVPHGHTLTQLGFASDIRFAAQWDTSQGIPRFSLDAGQEFLVGTLT